METTQVIQTLRSEVNSDKFAQDICTVLAVKPRARFTLTVDALKQRMEKEGFPFDKERARNFLRILARLGLGKIEQVDGKVVGLTEIKTTLQSIGKVGLGEEKDLDKFRVRHRYTKLADVPKAAMASTKVHVPRPRKIVPKAVQAPPAPAPVATRPPVSVVGLAVSLNGRTVRLPISEDLSVEEIALIVDRFREPKRA